MKKSWIAIPVFIGLLILWGTAFGETEESGRVLTVKRDVYLLRAGQQLDARARDPLLLEDVVITDHKSRTKLFFKDDSILNLGERSRVEVAQYLYSSEKERSQAVYTLLEGSLKVVVGRSDLEIHTPTAVAAARGTKFIVGVKGTGADLVTLIMVLQGEVLVKSVMEKIKEIATLQQGQMTRVAMGKPPERPVQTPPHLLEQYMAGTVAIGEVFRDTKDRIPLPDTSGGDGMPQVSEQEAVWEAIKDLGQPPINQEPVKAMEDNFTNANVNIEFPEGP